MENLIVRVSCHVKSARKTNDLVSKVVCHGVVLASSIGNSMSQASRAVSSLSLAALEGDPDFIPRTCTCRIKRRDEKRELEASKIQEDNSDEMDVDPSAVSVDHMQKFQIPKATSS
jgi:hypothetical protein